MAYTFGNRWISAKPNKHISISMDGLNATNDSNAVKWQSVWAEKGFTFSVDTPVSLFYFEVTDIISSYQ
jgi:hypothetical protein